MRPFHTHRGVLFFGSFILGTQEIERDLDRADQNGKAVTHAEDRYIPGTHILGVDRVPKIERDLDRADRNEKAVTHAEDRHILGAYILGVHRVPKIKRDLDRADRNEKAVAHAEGRHILGASILGSQTATYVQPLSTKTPCV